MEFDLNNLVNQASTVLTTQINANKPAPPNSNANPAPGTVPVGQAQEQGNAPHVSTIPWMYIGIGVGVLIVGVIVYKSL